MSSKVLLPKDVAEELTAIEQHESYPIRYVVDVFKNDVVKGETGALKKYFESDRSRRIGIIMNALINGFEVEETPEDKVRQRYQILGRDRQLFPEQNDRFHQQMIGIKDTLDMLNIRIEGVNAE